MITKRKYIKKVIVTDSKSSAEARAHRLRQIRNMANLTREEMCSDPSLNINTYKGWEIAKYGGLPVDGAEKVVKRIAKEGVVCSVDWLLHEIGVGPFVIPDYKKAQHDQQKHQVEFDLDKEEELIINEILLFRKQFKETTDFKIEDDGLSPQYQPDDFVAGIKYYGNHINKLIGKDCILQTTDGKTLVRNLKPGEESDRYMLICSNLQTQVKHPVLYEVSLASAAAIIRHYRKTAG